MNTQIKEIFNRIKNRTKKESVLLHIKEYAGITNKKISDNSGFDYNLVKKYTRQLYMKGLLDRFVCSGKTFYK